jgi:hypothetical protein
MQSKDVYLMCFEGEAEENLFAYLKSRFCPTNKTFKPISLKGFNSLEVFKRKYNQVYRANGLKKRKLGEKVHFIFLIDGDLDDTPAIITFIESEGHRHQTNNQNTESVLLRMTGTSLTVDTLLSDFRKKSKAKFVEKFGKEAHQMKDKDFDAILDEAIFTANFPMLHQIFNE